MRSKLFSVKIAVGVLILMLSASVSLADDLFCGGDFNGGCDITCSNGETEYVLVVDADDCKRECDYFCKQHADSTCESATFVHHSCFEPLPKLVPRLPDCRDYVGCVVSCALLIGDRLVDCVEHCNDKFAYCFAE